MVSRTTSVRKTTRNSFIKRPPVRKSIALGVKQTIAPAKLREIKPIASAKDLTKAPLTEATLHSLSVVPFLLYEMNQKEVDSKRRWLYKINKDGFVRYFSRYDGRFLMIWRMPTV